MGIEVNNVANNKEDSNTVAFPKWVLALIGIGILIWTILNMLPEPERVYRIQGTIETQVQVKPLSP